MSVYPPNQRISIKTNRCTSVRKRFIPAEEVNHFNSASLAMVGHFKSCETLVHAKMDGRQR